jgi:hypothetical protein
MQATPFGDEDKNHGISRKCAEGGRVGKDKEEMLPFIAMI